MVRKWLFVCTLLTATGQVVAQPVENCNNSIDDDGDGKIDLNDPDCKCNGIKDTLFIPSSLIPNPSFEEYTCCPTGLAELNCSKNWIQASDATSDYFHTCGFKSDRMRGSPPQPLPAGDGYVGFLDLYLHPSRNATYKEYVGACLTSPMIAGREYTLSFWIGFGTRGTSYGPRASTTLAIFGAEKCASLPFGNANSWLCPTAYGGWYEMAKVTASGTNKWVKVNLKIVPGRNMETIVIGPECTRADGYYYYFIDELILEESVKFDSLILNIAGEPCKDSIKVSTSSVGVARIQYQWFKDGIAIPNASLPGYVIPRGEEGKYTLKAIDGNDCELSNDYDYQLDTTWIHWDTSLCKGESILVDGRTLDTSGLYQFILQDYKGCDSVVEVNLKINQPKDRLIDLSICEGNSVIYNGHVYDSTGMYAWTNPDQNGCDSVTRLDLYVGKIVRTSWDTSICEGDELIAGTKRYTNSGTYQQMHTSALGCDSVHTIFLKVHPKQSSQLDTSICQGDSLYFNQNVLWTAGTYRSILPSRNGCDSSITLNLSIKPTYSIPFDVTRCASDSFTLGNVVMKQSGLYSIPLSSSQGCDSIIRVNYNAIPPVLQNVDTSVCPGETVVIGGIQYNQAGNYQQLYSASKGCDSLVSIHIALIPQPDWTAQLQHPKCAGDINGQIHIALNGTNGPYIFTWNDGFLGRDRDQLNAGTYRVTITDANQCKVFDQFDLLEPDPLVWEITTTHANCKTPLNGKLNILQYTGGQQPYTFVLDGQKLDSSRSNVDVGIGTHTIQYIDANGCLDAKVFTILEPKQGDVSLYPDSINVILGDSVFVSLNVSNIDSIVDIQWAGPGIIRCAFCADTYIIPGKEGGVYKVQLTDVYGCIYYAQLRIQVDQKFYVPNVFSPNGDNINDFFYLISDRSVDLIESLKIFDRWGNLQYEGRNIHSNLPNEGWNGEFNGQKSLPGVYVYLFEFKDKGGAFHRLSGDLTLVR